MRERDNCSWVCVSLCGTLAFSPQYSAHYVAGQRHKEKRRIKFKREKERNTDRGDWHISFKVVLFSISTSWILSRVPSAQYS